MIKPSKLIEQPLTFFLEKSGDPWAMKDRESRYLFINDAALYYYGIPKNFDYFGCLDSELPHPGAELAEEFQKNDKIIIEKEKTIIEIETHTYGKNQTLQPHLCKKSPFYDTQGQCTGILCQGLNIKISHIYSGCFEKNNSLTTNSINYLFTKRDLDIIFWVQQRLASKEIARKLNLSPRTIENKLQLIYEKANVHSRSQFIKYCKSVGLDGHIPESLLNKGVITINTY